MPHLGISAWDLSHISSEQLTLMKADTEQMLSDPQVITHKAYPPGRLRNAAQALRAYANYFEQVAERIDGGRC